MKEIIMPNIKVDTDAINKAGKEAREGVKKAAKIAATSTLSSYKLKTILGKKLPQEDIPAVTKLVKEMYEKGWLTPADENWCLKNGIDYK